MVTWTNRLLRSFGTSLGSFFDNCNFGSLIEAEDISRRAIHPFDVIFQQFALSRIILVIKVSQPISIRAICGKWS
jgi:hypothetical protein